MEHGESVFSRENEYYNITPTKRPTYSEDSPKKRSGNIFSSFTNAVKKIFQSIGNSSTNGTPHGDSGLKHGDICYAMPQHDWLMKAGYSQTDKELGRTTPDSPSTFCEVELDSIHTMADVSSQTTVDSDRVFSSIENLNGSARHQRRDCDNTYEDMDYLNITFPSDASTCTTLSGESRGRDYKWCNYGDRDDDTCNTVTINDTSSTGSQNNLISFESIVNELDFVWHERRSLEGYMTSGFKSVDRGDGAVMHRDHY